MAKTTDDLSGTEVQGRARLLTVPEAAAVLNVTVQRIYHLTSQRRIPYIKLGQQLRFDPERLSEFIERATVEPEPKVREPQRSGRRKVARRGSSTGGTHKDGAGSGRRPRFNFATPRRNR